MEGTIQSMDYGLFITIVGYAVAITAWLVRLQMTVISINSTKADRESILRANARIEALEKSVDGVDGIKSEMKEITKFMQSINLKLEKLLSRHGEE